MPRQSGMQTRSGTSKRKRRSSDSCSNIENEPLQEEKRFKEERFYQLEDEDESTTDERLPLSELPVLRLAVGVELDDFRREDYSPDSFHAPQCSDSSIASPFQGDYLEEKILSQEDDLNIQTKQILQDCSPESPIEPFSSQESCSLVKSITKVDSSLTTSHHYLVDKSKIILHWPTILQKVEGEKTKTWKNYFTCIDTESLDMRKIDLFNNHPGLQPRMRAVLLEWLIEVCDAFKLHRETYYLAVDYIDRFLSFSCNVPKVKLQLIGISCLLIACKIEEIYPPKVAEFAFVTDGACSEDDILTMEINVIKVLKWKFKCITSNCWLLIYLQLGYFCVRKEKTLDYLYPLYPPELYSTVVNLLDLVTLDISSMRFKHSELAISALHVVCSEKFPLLVSGYELHEIKECVQLMEAFWSAIKDKKQSEDPSFQPIVSPPKRLVTDVSHFLQQHVINLELLEIAQANVERLMHPSPSSLNLLTPPSSSKKSGCPEVL